MDVKIEDVVGQDEAKKKARIILEYLKNPKKFGKWAPKNVLFYGPPGTGKTMTAKALCVNSGEYLRFALSIRMDFIKPAFPGEKLIAEAEIEHGRKIAFCRLEVKKGDETVARGLAIAYSRGAKRP